MATVNTIAAYTDFKIIQYKQYYIAFTVDGTKVLDTTEADNEWQPLSEYADIPVTVIQTGNAKVELEGNNLTDSYKHQYVIKTDSDDTIYNLPEGETASVVFPSQTDITYTLEDANDFTRDRLIRKLNTPASYNVDGLISMVGEKIAIAHDDRVDISLDYGETFYTVVYPTTGGANYKNTASLSEDGSAFFYVHTNGVYRHLLGSLVNQWELLKVIADHSYILLDDELGVDTLNIEDEVHGVLIDSTARGANYCHFVNSEKFAFMLAHFRAGIYNDWIAVVYTKGLNLTNLFDNDLESYPNVVNSFALSVNLTVTGLNNFWNENLYLNKRKSRIIDNDTVVFYVNDTANTHTGIILKATPTHIYTSIGGGSTTTRSIDYVTSMTHTIDVGSTHSITDLQITQDDIIRLLINTGSSSYWKPITYSLEVVEYDSPAQYSRTFTAIAAPSAYTLNDMSGSSLMVHRLTDEKYLTPGLLQLVDANNDMYATYTMPLLNSTLSRMVIANANYIVYDEPTDTWYTNLPLMATLTYTYEVDTNFTQVPTAVYSDQNLWLAMNKTLWIGNLVDDKISVLPINSNVFSKEITGICPISATSKAIFFVDSITLCEQIELTDGSNIWKYYSLKFTLGIRKTDTVITTNEGKYTIFPTKYGLAVLTYQLDIAATEQAITYISDDIKTLWSQFYAASTGIKILHHNTQLILSNGTNQVLIYDFRTNGWYPLTFPTGVNVTRLHSNITNYEILELYPEDAPLTSLTNIYQLNKEQDELYAYATPYKDFGTAVIPWHLTSQLLLLSAPNNYKNISQLIIDQIDSDVNKQSAYLTTQIFRQRANTIKPSLELVYNIDTFGKIVKKVNWWKVLGIKWQLENDASSSYPTQLRLYNISITYDISYEVK